MAQVSYNTIFAQPAGVGVVNIVIIIGNPRG
jgi:hypothetical protein